MSTIVKLALACAVQCFGGNALAQTTFNHLDCWFDESASQMRCPGSVPIQSGRDARVEQTFDIVGGEPAVSSGQAAVDQEAKPEPTPPRVRARRTSTRMAQAPRCTRYRTYNAATGSYRGYDGVTRACR